MPAWASPKAPRRASTDAPDRVAPPSITASRNLPYSAAECLHVSYERQSVDSGDRPHGEAQFDPSPYQAMRLGLENRSRI